MRRLDGRWAMVLLATLAIAPASRGDEGWVGKRVIPKPGAVLEVVGATKGTARSPWFHLYRVERADGPVLVLTDEVDQARVRARPDQIMPFDRAIDDLTALIAAEPKRSDAYIWRGFVHYVRREFDLAFDDYNQACRLDPKNPEALTGRSSVRSARGQIDGAIADISEAIRLKPTSSLYISRANIKRRIGKLDSAIADDSEAIRLDPGSAIAWYNRGTLFTDKNEFDKAIADFGEAIRLHPAFTTAYVARGHARLTRRDYGRAMADFDAAIRTEPNPPSRVALAYVGRAMLRAASPNAKDRDGAKAVEDARRAIELTQGQSIDAFEALAAALAETGDFSDAEDAQRRAVSLAAAANLPSDRFDALVDRVRLYVAGKPYRLPAAKK